MVRAKPAKPPATRPAEEALGPSRPAGGSSGAGRVAALSPAAGAAALSIIDPQGETLAKRLRIALAKQSKYRKVLDELATNLIERNEATDADQKLHFAKSRAAERAFAAAGRQAGEIREAMVLLDRAGEFVQRVDSALRGLDADQQRRLQEFVAALRAEPRR